MRCRNRYFHTVLLLLLLGSSRIGFPADPFSINSFPLEQDREFIDLTINTFMQQYDLVGLSIAIARQGEIIFASGYGYADKEGGRRAGIADQYRIASVSKPITAVAIMKLVEDGKLALDSKVFGDGGLLPIPYPRDNQHVANITVRHLLEHTAAVEWENKGEAPMFHYTNLDKRDLVAHILKTRKLSRAPGSGHHYSNFGYCVLGLIIEEVTGQSYADYVKDTIFAHINARSFDIASNKRSTSFPEVRYYSNNHEDPYSYRIARMDAHGGWIANVIDLVMFSLAVDGMAEPPDLLSKESIRLMSTPSAKNNNYALGWNVNKSLNRWHMGSLPGTAAILVRTESGYSWAILTNRRSDKESFAGELDALPWNLINGIKQMP